MEADLLAFVDEAGRVSFDSATTCRQSCRAFRTLDHERSTELDASLIEYFDDRALKFISEKFPETPSGMAGAIFFEQETTRENEDALFEAVE